MDNIRDMFDLRDVYHDVVNYGESNQERFTHRWLSFIGFFTGKPPPPLASPSLKSGSRKDEFARLVDGGKGGDVEMSHVPGIHAAGMDGRHMHGDRSGGGSRFADAGRRRERRREAILRRRIIVLFIARPQQRLVLGHFVCACV